MADLLETPENIETFLRSLEDYPPTIPDDVASFFLQRTGFNCPDIRTKRVVSIAAQKFISEIANDALQFCKIRQQSTTQRDKARGKDKKLVLTMEDLALSLKEYGINVKKPDYYADKVTSGLDVSTQNPSEKPKDKPTPKANAKEKVIKEKVKTAKAKAKTAGKAGKTKAKVKKTAAGTAATAAAAALNDNSLNSIPATPATPSTPSTISSSVHVD